VLDSLYVDRALSKAMSTFLLEGVSKGRWNRLTRPQEFADSVTAQLRAIAHDKHLRLIFEQHDPRIVENVTPEEQKRRYDETMQDIEDSNYGFPEVRILPGNVGLVRMDNFIVPWLGSPALAAAMAFVNHSRGLILDLRRNGGGHSDQYVLTMSYFLEQPAKLGESFSRADSTVEQSWTYAVVPGPRYDSRKPVYVLTSRETFSAAEALTEALRTHRKAVIVGETTRGGGHMGDFQPVGERFLLFVPSAASTTGDELEGRGLRPDIATRSDRALEEAHRLALGAILSTLRDSTRYRAFQQILRQADQRPAGRTAP